MEGYKIHEFPKTRIATIDVFEMGKQKHHVTALIEVDVTSGREKIADFRKAQRQISFTSWLIKVISDTLKNHENIAAYLKGKHNLVVFKDINISLIVEKEMQGHKIPIPLVIEKANEKSMEEIARQIRDAREKPFTDKDIVLQKKSSRLERFYYALPGFARRFFWRYLLRHPRFAFAKMGNVAMTSVGMMGKVNGWFVPASVHPICFGLSGVVQKPVVVGGKIEIREILNMTILLDHDVADGAPMARFISELSQNIENGVGL